MSLRRQLLIVSLLLLSLPWAGCQFAREMEVALREGKERSLQATADAVAAVLRDRPDLIYPNPDRITSAEELRPSIYATPLNEPIFVDGYDDGWEEVNTPQLFSEYGDPALSVSYQAVTRRGKLYLLFKIVDSEVVYHNPGLSREPNGDRLKLRTWKNGRRQDYVIATAAPGKVRAQYDSPIHPGTDAGRIRGQWQDSEQGYTLELEIPLSDTGDRLGFSVINVNGKEGEAINPLGNISLDETAAPPWLIYTPEALQKVIAPFGQPGRQLQVSDNRHWLVADHRAANGAVERRSDGKGQTFWLLRLLYRSMLSEDDSQTRAPTAEFGKTAGDEIDQAMLGSTAIHRYIDADYASRTILASASPVYNQEKVVGAVSIRESSEAYLSLTDQAFSRIFGYSLAAICIGVIGLLGYASILSWRIGALSKAASKVVHDDGYMLNNFPRSRVADEIGELSRSYADLLDKLHQYNDYLRTLSQKLSHELRTPIAVIQTSLENLETSSEQNVENKVYLTRAREGLTRLGKILNAMSEASGLEDSIRGNNKVSVDLRPFLEELYGAYTTLYSDHKIFLECTIDQAMTLAAPELLAQALDKFMDNATSFCPASGKVIIRLREIEDDWLVEVINEGPLLPDEMQSQLFNSMVSMREKSTEVVRLGLGLHIAQLIAAYHGARIDIRNLDDGSGVCSSLSLKKETLSD